MQHGQERIYTKICAVNNRTQKKCDQMNRQAEQDLARFLRHYGKQQQYEALRQKRLITDMRHRIEAIEYQVNLRYDRFELAARNSPDATTLIDW